MNVGACVIHRFHGPTLYGTITEMVSPILAIVSWDGHGTECIMVSNLEVVG